MKMEISTRKRNLMNAYIGKSYKYYSSVYGYMWTTKIIGFDNCGYFITELCNGEKTWQSNSSYSEIRLGIKEGYYIPV